MGFFQHHAVPWYDRTWGHLFSSFEEFLAFSWPVITVTDNWTGRAHIVTRLSSIHAFLKMVKTRYVARLALSFLPCALASADQDLVVTQIRRNAVHTPEYHSHFAVRDVVAAVEEHCGLCVVPEASSDARGDPSHCSEVACSRMRSGDRDEDRR